MDADPYWAAGGSEFVDRLEALVGRSLRPRKPGRPRKHEKSG